MSERENRREQFDPRQRRNMDRPTDAGFGPQSAATALLAFVALVTLYLMLL
jgi:hypothetical protein